MEVVVDLVEEVGGQLVVVAEVEEVGGQLVVEDS
jgi:hypothetical protein